MEAFMGKALGDTLIIVRNTLYRTLDSKIL
jgi:hypothetical protein